MDNLGSIVRFTGAKRR